MLVSNLQKASQKTLFKDFCFKYPNLGFLSVVHLTASLHYLLHGLSTVVFKPNAKESAISTSLSSVVCF